MALRMMMMVVVEVMVTEDEDGGSYCGFENDVGGGGGGGSYCEGRCQGDDDEVLELGNQSSPCAERIAGLMSTC